MPLTDLEIRQAKPRDKNYKLSDEKGLHLLVTTSGTKLWRFKYRVQGKEKLLSIGSYPEVKLSHARDITYQARKHLFDGIDPGALKKLKKAANVDRENTFKSVGIE